MEFTKEEEIIEIIKAIRMLEILKDNAKTLVLIVKIKNKIFWYIFPFCLPTLIQKRFLQKITK